MKTIKLEDFEVEIKEQNELKYTDVEAIQKSAMGGMKFDKGGQVQSIDGSKMVDAKRKVAEVIIESIKDNEGNKVEFSQEWIDNLSAMDGMDLMQEIDNQTKDIVKKKMKGAK